MRRFIIELFRPALKCKRIGHSTFKQRNVQKMVSESRGNGVADLVHGTETICARCKCVLQFDEHGRDILTAVEMPSYMYKKLREKGFLYR